MFDYSADLRPYFASRDPTPKLTAEASPNKFQDGPTVDRVTERQIAGVRSKAFETAAEYAQFWWDVGPAKDRCTWRALEDLKVGLRALAKEQADG